MREWLVNQLEISHGNNTPLRAMEGLRGLAVSLVFLVHYSTLIEPWLTPKTTLISSFIHSASHVGVDLFFILSGYLIYGTIINKKQFHVRRYINRRVIRIYPTFLAVFAIYLLLSLIFPAESKLPSAGDELTLYLIQNLLLLPGIFNIEPIITVAWSLSYEVFYYLLIPSVIFLFKMQKWGVNQRVFFWLATTVFGFIWFYSNGGHIRLMMFIAGIILFEVHKIKNIQLKHLGTTCFIVALVLFGTRFSMNINYELTLSCIYFLFGIFCLNAFSVGSFSARWLVFSPLRWLGNMSYSYYLIHGLTLKCCFLVFSLIFTQNSSHEYLYFWLWLPFFGLTLITSLMLFLVIEKPFSINKKQTPRIT